MVSGFDVNVELLVAGFKMAADGKPEWDPIIESTIPDCAGIVKAMAPELEKASKLPPLDPADPICSGGPGFMLFCAVKTLFQVTSFLILNYQDPKINLFIVSGLSSKVLQNISRM